MKLTCVTATFNCVKSGNRERLIRCVESVAKLKTEHEHLVYDGASTDGTADLLLELEKRIPCLKVVSEPDTGIYNALNKGVRDAKGEWFYVLGCDDYISNPENFDKVIRDTDESTAMIVAKNIRSDDPRPRPNDWSQLVNIYWDTPHCHQRVIVRTSVTRDCGGFDESYKIVADGDMLQKIHHSHRKIEYCNFVISCYGAGGLSETLERCRLEERERLCKKHFGYTSIQWKRMRERDCADMRYIIQYLFAKDRALRIGARIMLWRTIRRIAKKIPCLDSIIKSLRAKI